MVHKSRFLSLPDIQDFSRGLKLKDATICLCQEWEGNKNNQPSTLPTLLPKTTVVLSHIEHFYSCLARETTKIAKQQFFTFILPRYFTLKELQFVQYFKTIRTANLNTQNQSR